MALQRRKTKPRRRSESAQASKWRGRRRRRRLAGRDFRAAVVRDHLRIRVSKDLHWILPYLERTHRIMPSLQMPLVINSYRPRLTRRLRTLGSSYYDEGIINLATHQQTFIRLRGNFRRIKGIRRMAKKKILETLAHELAHLHVVDHNFEHEEMTRTIFKTFGLTEDCPHCEGSGKVEARCNPH